MGVLGNPEGSEGYLSAVKNALSIFGPTNKTGGIAGDVNQYPPEDEYESKMSDKDIIELISVWKQTYSPYYEPIRKSQELSFNYWVGKQRPDEKSQVNRDTPELTKNLLFEAIETFLPIATRANPDPVVSADPSDTGQEIAKDIKIALVDWADRELLRRKLALMTRQWMLNRLGVAKLSWHEGTGTIRLDNINAKRMIFDRDGHIDLKGRFVGEYLGEKKKATAQTLLDMFPKKKEEIIKKCHGKMATKLEYYEWWYRNTDVFFTLDDTVLGKHKNPNWNYDGDIPVNPQIEEESEDDVRETMHIEGTNHWKEMWNPYIFLSIFSTGEQPHDDTSLIIQNISLQDLINRRMRQIDKNVEGMNNGLVVSGTAFTEEQASQAAGALRRGVAIRVPNGDVGKAVLFPQRPGLPADVFNNLRDGEESLQNIFGTAGSTAQGTESQDTVRGKILVSQQDSSRIGGGITEQIEQIADTVYNGVVQFMFVYYDDEHFVTSAGTQGGTELITIKNDMFPLLKTLNVTVKEGSLIPKDPMTVRNQSIDLWSANAIDPLNFYKALDVPDPVESTNQLMLWQLYQKGAIQPQMYLPSFAVAGQNANQTAQAQPQGQAVNPPPNAGVQNAPPEAGSPEAVQAQSKALLQAEPLPK